MGGETTGLRAPEAAARAGVSYRQLDYWDRTGLLSPSVTASSGSGSQRLYGDADVRVLTLIRRLLDAGCSVAGVRGILAGLRDGGGQVTVPAEWKAEVGPGVWISVTDEVVPS